MSYQTLMNNIAVWTKCNNFYHNKIHIDMKKAIPFYFLYLSIGCSIAFFACSQDTSADLNSNISDSSQDYIDGNANTPSNISGGNNEIVENPWIYTVDETTSTFSVDADGGSFANVRRYLNDNNLPPVNVIRTEELINYFPMDYDFPQGDDPIALNAEIAECPWTQGNQLLRIGIQGKEILHKDLPATNFVFLIDVSGSMDQENKLDLLKQSFILFTDELEADDRIAIVTYAGSSKLALPSTSGSEKETIKAAINSLGAGGGTAGAQGIITAYDIAQENFIEGGNNRVILGTDGDFNIGIYNQDELISLIEEKRETGIFLTVLGVGTGNYQDEKMEQLANNGNGTYEYIDNLEQAKKVFLHEPGKFHTVAKDVKVQIEFDKNQVEAYRLIGYENRLLSNPDFENDEKDAGEIGANQSITAIYEIRPTNSSLGENTASIDFRYKKPDGSQSVPLTLNLSNNVTPFAQSSENMRFTATVAGFGMLLRDSEYKGNLDWENLSEWLANATTFDPHGYRTQLMNLIEIAEGL